MKYGIISCLSLLLLCACGAQTSQRQALLEEAALRPIRCEAGADCESKWNRAREWVTRHSKTGVMIATDKLIEANMMSSGDTTPVLKYPEFSVIKSRYENTIYDIKFRSYCDEGFQCSPSGLELRASFAGFVMQPLPFKTMKGIE
jgi:hypothetical protein